MEHPSVEGIEMSLQIYLLSQLNALSFDSCSGARPGKLRGSIAGIWDKAAVVFLPSSFFTIHCPHLQVVSCPYQSHWVGTKENMEKKWEGNCCAQQIPAFVLTSGPTSSQAYFSSFKELGIGEAEVVLAGMIKNLPSKDAT